MNNEFIVNVIGIGQGKAASTWIYNILDAHPDICGSNPKETDFFCELNYNPNLKYYKRCFKHCPPNKVKVEFSTSYLSDPAVASRIKKHFPKARLIVVFRDPVDRLISHYYFGVQRGKFVHNIDEHFKARISKGPLYYESFKPFIDVFGRDKIYVILFDDIKNNPQKVVSSLYKFTGVSSDFMPDLTHKKSNKTISNTVRLRLLNKYLFRIRSRFIAGNRHITGSLRALKINKLGTLFFKFNTKKDNKTDENYARTGPSEEIIKEYRAYFKDDIKKLEQYLDRELSLWYN